ncbi:nitrogenase femo-cofactor scaffold and assembly protein nife [hydrocarbon metagenome]|uniref:Nitrogenase femo-cofactor scaffold and assembly protein nife n=1 Tax=hydrocarbon metagenome TaxID=938273 RepID=A0A0W8FJC8_9ZZZZ
MYHINYILGMRGDRPSQIYSTCLDENDVIFGAEEKLKEAIEELDSELGPEVIAVLSCCASSIIGEDVERIAEDATTDARVIGIASGGFEGDFRTGYSETLKRLVEELVERPQTVDPRAVNLIGLLRGGPDLRELRRILGLIGVRVNAVLTANATLAEIRSMGSAALNILVCEPAGKEAAECLLEKCNTPYITEELPIGHAATHRFLEDVAEALGIAAGVDTADMPPQHAAPLRHRRVAVIGGPTRALSMTRFLLEHGSEPAVIVVDFDAETKSRLEALVGAECAVLIEPEQEEIVQALKERHVDLIVGGMLERPIAAALGIEHLDIMHGSQKTVGFAGADNLIRALAKRKDSDG